METTGNWDEAEEAWERDKSGLDMNWLKYYATHSIGTISQWEQRWKSVASKHVPEYQQLTMREFSG